LEEVVTGVNWLAVIVGTVVAFGLGMLWFSPKMFGKKWAEGSHNIQPPESPPIGAIIVQFIGTFLMAWLVGITAKNNALLTIIVAIFAIAILQAAAGMFGQKSRYAVWVDAGYVIAMGIIMIIVQGIF
jgi:Protein of unknown function (DUF1761)